MMSHEKFKFFYTCAVILIAVLISLAVTSLITAVLGANVLETFYIIFCYPFKSMKNLSGVINIMTPLAIVGIGICVAYRSGFINLGGEGQMTIGIVLSLILGVNAPSGIPKIIALPAMLMLGALGGAVWGAIAGWLKNRFAVSELLSTVMLNYIASQLFSYCLRIPMMDPTVNGEAQTVKLPKGMWLSKINELFPFLGKNTKFHSGLFIAVILAVVIFLLMWKTGAGYKMRAAGLSERAARYGGINVKKYALLSVILSGAMCGLAGTVEILGIHHRGLGGCTGGYGFSGIVVALFGGLHPIGVLPAAFFFAVISFGCSSLQINGSPLPSNTIDVLQGLVILVIVATQMILKNRYIIDRAERFVNKHFFKKSKGAEKAC